MVVLGSGGFLGPHLVRAALAAGRVVAVRRGEADVPGVAAGERLVCVAADLVSPGAVERLVDDHPVRGVILSAALARVGECERDPRRAEVLNRDLPARVARICAARGIRLVHVSTDLVFGARPPRGERFTEEDPPAPVHVYGRTKSEGEAAVLEAWPEALVVRLPLLYGDSGGRGLGASDSVWDAVARGQQPGLFEDEWRTPLDVAAAARALVEALDGEARGLLHVAGPQRVSRLELGVEALTAGGFTPAEAAERVRASTRSEAGLADVRPADVSLDIARAQALLDTPLLAPREALRGGTG